MTAPPIQNEKMPIETTPLRPKRADEKGYILLAVLFMVVLVLIALSVAAPKVAADIERDREVELMHRGQQYRRGIQLYYRKFGAYPPNMDALEKSNEIRFLRKRYRDPETGKDEWHLIHFGENKLPTVMGFFGQAMSGTGGSTLAGVGPGGVGQSLGSSLGGSSSGSAFGGSTFGSSGSGIGGSSLGGSSFGSSGTDNSGTSSGASNGTSGPGFGSTPGSGLGSSSGSSLGSGSSSTDPTSGTIGSGTAGSSFSGSSTNGSGQTFGGGGIIGVESTSPKLAILEYKKKKHFNEWEFVYDPQQERMQISGNTGTIGQPASGIGNSTTGSPNSPSLLNQAPTTPTTPVGPTSPTTTTPQ